MLTGIYSRSSRREPSRPLRFTLAPSYAPRGVSIPFDLTQLRIPPVTTGVWVPPAFLATRLPRERVLRRATRHSSLATSPLFSPTYGLFIPLCALFPVPVLSFQQLADSFAKTPGGGGGSSLAFKRPDAPSASRSNFWTLGGSRRRLPVPEMYLRDGQTELQTFRQEVTTRGGRCNRSWS